MLGIVKLPTEERSVLIEAVSMEIGLGTGIVEKTCGFATHSTTCSTAASSRTPSCSRAGRACQRHTTSSSGSPRTSTSYSTDGS